MSGDASRGVRPAQAVRGPDVGNPARANRKGEAVGGEQPITHTHQQREDEIPVARIDCLQLTNGESLHDGGGKPHTSAVRGQPELQSRNPGFFM